MTLKIGLIGIVGQEMKADPWGTLERVAEVGYEGVEGAAGIAGRAEVSTAELLERMKALGLDVIAHSIRLHVDPTETDSAIATAKEVGCKYLIQYWGPCESRDQLLRQAGAFDRVGARCREEGLTFCYHNHNHEFATFDGQTAFDILMSNTDPQNVQAELDVAWVTYGGADPVALVRQYAGRCPVLHMKDFVRVPEGGATGNDEREDCPFTEVGTGVVDIAGVVDAARESGVEWLVVEQDRMHDLPPMESIAVSYRNLKRALG